MSSWAGPGSRAVGTYPAQPYRVRRSCGHWEIVRLRAPPTPYLRDVAATIPCPRCRPADPDARPGRPAGSRRAARARRRRRR